MVSSFLVIKKGYVVINQFVINFLRQSGLLDAASGVHIRFRLGGVSFILYVFWFVSPLYSFLFQDSSALLSPQR